MELTGTETGLEQRVASNSKSYAVNIAKDNEVETLRHLTSAVLLQSSGEEARRSDLSELGPKHLRSVLVC